MGSYHLDSFLCSLTSLNGIGPQLKEHFEHLLNGSRIIDLLKHLPLGFLERHDAQSPSDNLLGQHVTIEVMIMKHQPSYGRKSPYRIRCKSSQDVDLNLVFFNSKKIYLQQHFIVGQTMVVSGKLDSYKKGYQITHPDRYAPIENRDRIRAIEPIYPLTKGISSGIFQRTMGQCLKKISPLPEWICPYILHRHDWPDFYQALHDLHTPSCSKDFHPRSPHRMRLAYDELLAQQISLALLRKKSQKIQTQPITMCPQYHHIIESHLPFSLTVSQTKALNEILNDLEKPYQMVRLLQGDVGSGKTIVALMSCLNVMAQSRQTVLMAPTDLLAHQHYESMKNFLTPLNITPVLMTRQDSSKIKEEKLKSIENGKALFIIGTHNLFQNHMIYKDLAFVIIDEQHRFGVQQRIDLSKKGNYPHILVMSATPIPRSLAMTCFGDMSLSIMHHKPKSRQKIDTHVIKDDKIPELMMKLKSFIQQDQQVYWVCPFIENHEKYDFSSATDRYHALGQVIDPEKIGFIHARIKPEERDQIMARFIDGQIKILVATTLIEVGVNVPNATVMIIENAQHFGLSQLHQLRGRVGRSEKKSRCLLICSGHLTAIAQERLKILKKSDNGFMIADKDLELRGMGEILGTKQSGSISYDFFDFSHHSELIDLAKNQAENFINGEREIMLNQWYGLKMLLTLFDHKINDPCSTVFNHSPRNKNF